MLDEHKLFENFGGGETSKQGQAVETRVMSDKQCQSVSPGLKGRERFGCNDTKCAVQNMEGSRFFPRPFKHGEDLSSHMGGQSVNGGTFEGGHRHHGGPNFDRLLYHTLKVLLLLLLLCISQFQA